MNPRILLLVVGLLVGAVLGWFTRPNAGEIAIGPVSIEVQGNQTENPNDTSLTGGQARHLAIFAGLGALIGLGLGFAVDRRRP